MSEYVDKHEIEFWKNAYNNYKKWEDIRSYQAQLESKNIDIAALQKEVHKLRKERGKIDMTISVDELKNPCYKRGDEVKQYQQWVIELQKEVDKLREERERLQSDFEGAVRDNLRILEDKENIYREYKHQQEQIETLRFDNEHLQKDIAEKDLQIAALKDQLSEYQKPIVWPPIDWGVALEQHKDKIQKLKKEKDHWQDAAKNEAIYWKAQAEDLRRKNEVYEKLLKPIIEYAQTLSKT
jgi:chromosome segregation ATPase